MVGPDEIITVTVNPLDYARVLRLASRAEIGGSSSIYSDKDERMSHLHEDQIVGQLGQLVGTRHFHGSIQPYIVSRWYQNRMPLTGDAGSDIAGANVDFKTSLMRAGSDPLKYRMIVRPRERHENWVYVQMLVAELGERSATVHIVGWARDSMLPAQVETSGPFQGAYVLPVTSLHPVPPFQWNWLD